MTWMVGVFGAHAHFPLAVKDALPGGCAEHGEFGDWYVSTFGKAKWREINARSAEPQKDWWRG